MKKLFFITRHVATKEQVELATKHGYEIESVGDIDAFGDHAQLHALIERANECGGAIAVVHPALALRVRAGLWNGRVAVFENGNRAPEGEKPQFFAKELHFF